MGEGVSACLKHPLHPRLTYILEDLSTWFNVGGEKNPMDAVAFIEYRGCS
jgi:hypothetical protein